MRIDNWGDISTNLLLKFVKLSHFRYLRISFNLRRHGRMDLDHLLAPWVFWNPVKSFEVCIVETGSWVNNKLGNEEYLLSIKEYKCLLVPVYKCYFLMQDRAVLVTAEDRVASA